MQNCLSRVRTWLRLYIIDLVILVMVWGGFYRCTLANSDTLIGQLSPEATLNARLENFRWLGYVGDKISYLLHYYPYEHQKVSLGLFLIVMAASLVLLQQTFSKVLEGRLETSRSLMVYIAVTALCYVNVLIAELFYFTETFLCFKMSMLFAMLGSWLYSRRHYAIGALALIMAPMFYQVSCVQAALVLCTLAFLEERGEFSFRIVRKELAYIAVPMLAGLLNFATGPYILTYLSRFTGQSYSVAKQVTNFGDILGPEMRTELLSLYESGLGLMMPIFLPLLFSLVMTVAVAVAIHRNGKVLLTYGIYKAVTFAMTLCLQLMSSPRAFVPRMVWVICIMQAMNAILTLYYTDHERVCKWLQYCCVGYVLAQAFFIQIIISNRVLSENLDRIYANEIIDYILAYEEETCEEITHLAFRNDANSSDYYDQVYFCKNAINRRGYAEHGYSLVQIIALERGLSYEWHEMDEEIYTEYFEGKDWDSLNLEEQTVVQDGTMYICIF